MKKSRTPFRPVTGNPEAHDYLDWYRHLVRTGQIEPAAGARKDAKGPPPKRAPSKPASPRASPAKARTRKD